MNFPIPDLTLTHRIVLTVNDGTWTPLDVPSTYGALTDIGSDLSQLPDLAE